MLSNPIWFVKYFLSRLNPIAWVPIIVIESRDTISAGINRNITPDTVEWFDYWKEPINNHFVVEDFGEYDNIEIYSATKRPNGVWWALDSMSKSVSPVKMGHSETLTVERIILISNHFRGRPSTGKRQA